MSSPALCCEWPKFAQFGGQFSIARYRWFPNSVELPPSAAVLNEALTRLESETRTPMQSDRDCVFSALGGGGWPSVWLIRHDKGEYFHEENSSSNSRGVGSPEHRGLRTIRR